MQCNQGGALVLGGMNWSVAAGQGWGSEGAEFYQMFLEGGPTSHEKKKSCEIEVVGVGGGARGCDVEGGGASYQTRGVPCP